MCEYVFLCVYVMLMLMWLCLLSTCIYQFICFYIHLYFVNMYFSCYNGPSTQALICFSFGPYHFTNFIYFSFICLFVLWLNKFKSIGDFKIDCSITLCEVLHQNNSPMVVYVYYQLLILFYINWVVLNHIVWGDLQPSNQACRITFKAITYQNQACRITFKAIT